MIPISEPEIISEAPTVSSTTPISGIPASLSPPTASVEPHVAFSSSLDRPLIEWANRDVHRWLEENSLASVLP